MMANAPVFVMNQNQQREAGARAQLSNIQAAKAVSDIVKTTLGPKSMLKMLLDPMGGIVITNDGNCILRELDVSHPAAKSMIELSRTQDENVGDGTTSVIILTGELLKAAEPFLKATNSTSLHSNVSSSLNSQTLHPVVIVQTLYKALGVALDVMDEVSRTIDVNNREEMRKMVRSCVDTKYMNRYGDLMVDLAIEAVNRVIVERADGKKDIDTKRYVRVEKVPGGSMEDIKLIAGVMLNKDVTHQKMRRRIENPRILLLDCSLEYKKAESQTTLELSNEADFDALLRQEEEYVMKICSDIISFKPDLVITEKGVSDLAQHFLLKANITVLRRAKKTDNNRLARALGVQIVSNTEEITESNISTNCALYEVRKLGDEYFSFIEGCKDAKACTILLRGGSRDVINEMERNLHDCLGICRNIMLDPRVLRGGGCFEMQLSKALSERMDQTLFAKAIARALEVIPRTLLSNCGCDVVRSMTKLRAMHAGTGFADEGVDGDTGEIVKSEIVDGVAVKSQVVKTAFEAAAMILRIDDIISGVTKGKKK